MNYAALKMAEVFIENIKKEREEERIKKSNKLIDIDTLYDLWYKCRIGTYRKISWDYVFGEILGFKTHPFSRDERKNLGFGDFCDCFRSRKYTII
jgi:hypothetical protein